MKNQLVENSLQILRIYSSHNSSTGLNVNEIFRKTGSKDKKRITDSIKYLEKARLLETKKSKDHSQKRFKICTKLGNEFVVLMNTIDEYNYACVKLRNKLKPIGEISQRNADEKIKKNKLREIGLTDKEIKSYEHIMTWTGLIRMLVSPHEIINTILIRFISLLSKLSLDDNNNEIAIDILNRIVMNSISQQFTMIINAGYRDKISGVYSNLTLEKWNNVVGSILRSRFLDYSFIKEEFKNMSLLTLRILTPDEEMINKEINFLKEGEKNHLTEKNKEMRAKAIRSVISLCEEAYNRKLT